MICRKCKKEFDNNLPSCPHCGLPAGRANKPAQKKSNSQESFWIRMVAIAAAFFLVISTFAVVVTIEAGKYEDSSSFDKKDKDDKNENKKVNSDKNEGDGIQDIIPDSDEDDEDDFIPTDNPKYGTYPQTEVTQDNDFANYSKLEDEAEKITSWKSFNESGLSNIRYYDVTVGEQKYRAVKQISPENSEVHWFKFEPIEWVEFETSNEYQHKLHKLYITKKILDFRASDVTSDFYSTTNNLNSWLNSDSDGNFYRDVAFGNETKKPCSGMTYGVMLINKADVDALDFNKFATATDYARFIADNDSENQKPNTTQWLIFDKAENKLVTSDGKDYVVNTPVGIRPVVEFDEELSNQ